MRRFIINSFLFGIFALIIYICLTISFKLIGTNSLKKNVNYTMCLPGHTYTRLREVDSTKDINLLFIGSSHCYRGYDPRIFSKKNFKVFNLGSFAQTPIQTELLLDKYLEQLNPQSVIFDIYPVVFQLDGAESATDLIINGTIDKHTFGMALKINSIKVYNTLLYALFRQVCRLNKGLKELKIKGEDIYVGDGYVETYKKYVPKEISKKKKPIIISTNQLEAFERILARFKEKKIIFSLVQAPVSIKLYKAFKNNDEIDSIFMRYGQYYNFNKILALPDSMFFDDSHLNQRGVNIFNGKLKEVLKITKE